MVKGVNPKDVFFKYLPPASVDYCYGLWIKYNFQFKISKKRVSKLGDYTYFKTKKEHIITINADLNPFSFLVTYLHEVAHLLVNIKYTKASNPHGIEWKREFKEIASPLLVVEVFPNVILKEFIKYLQNPKAASCSDPHLLKALKMFDNTSDGIYLEEVAMGNKFTFNNRSFIREHLRKTRFLCKEVNTGRKYLISKLAVVNLEHE